MPLTLPDFIIDALQRYKRRNAIFIDWLLEKAGPQIEPGPEIRIARLVPLAQYLANRQQPALDVPIQILDALQKTITLRERCTNWYISKTHAEASFHGSNQRHEYFTNVLKDVRTVLEAARLSAKSAQASCGIQRSVEPVSRAEIKRSSRSSEPDEDLLNLSSLSKTSRRRTRDTSSEDTTSTFDDQYIALFLMLEESLEPLRQYVRQKWQEYQVGIVQLMTVSIIMNTAIQFAHRIESDFLARSPRFSTWEDVVSWMLPSATKNGLDSSHAHGNLLVSTFFPLFEQVYQFRATYRHLRDPKWRKRMASSSPKTTRSAHTTWNKGNRLDELLAAALLLQIHKVDLCTEDELMHGLKGVFSGDAISLWVLFGLQLIVEMTNVLGTNVTLGFHQLKTSAKQYTKSVEDYVFFGETINGGPWAKKRVKRAFSNVCLIDKWIVTDKFMQLQEVDPSIQPKLDDFAFFSHNTLASGVFQSAVLLNTQRFGVKLINADGLVLAMAHLYNVLKCEGRLESPWKNMETFIVLHGHELLIDQHIPGSLQAHLSYAKMALQGSISYVPADRRSLIKRDFRLQKNPGQIRKSAIMGTFEGLLCPDSDLPEEVTLEQIEHVLLRGKDDAASSLPYRQWQVDHKLKPVQLLEILQERIKEEQPKVLFDYYAMHHTCWQILAAIEANMDTEFRLWHLARTGQQVKFPVLSTRKLPIFVLENAIESSRSYAPETSSQDERQVVGRDILANVGSLVTECLTGGLEDHFEAEHRAMLGPAILWGILRV